MKGTRVFNHDGLRSIDGSYFFSEETQSWWCRTPNGHMGNLRNHDVTENDDGTITVAPSILVTTRINGVDKELYHGFLVKGEWR